MGEGPSCGHSAPRDGKVWRTDNIPLETVAEERMDHLRRYSVS